jgi:hypothetical protein
MKHLKEYEDFDDLEDLHRNMRDLGLTLTEDEERMLKFISQFGGGKSAEDFAEYLFDYYENPEEFDIDRDSDYYDAIADYYEEIEDCARYDLRGPMRIGVSKRWDISCLERSECYRTYKKISQYEK